MLSPKAPSWISEFRNFIMRGNVVDLAVGLIIGVAFTGVVSSLVKDVFNPFLGLLTGGLDFSNVFIPLNGQHYANLADAQKAGAANAQCRAFHQRDHPVPDRQLRDLLGRQGPDKTQCQARRRCRTNKIGSSSRRNQGSAESPALKRPRVAQATRSVSIPSEPKAAASHAA